jgi:hypothetical protein
VEGGPPSLAPKQLQLLKTLVCRQSDITFAELQQLLSERESGCCQSLYYLAGFRQAWLASQKKG